MAKIPDSLKSYFWDVDISKMDLFSKSSFVIQRLLDKGDDKAVRWVRDNFSDKDIKNTLTILRDFSPKVANFWAIFLKIPKEQIPCLQTPYLQRRKNHWPH